MIRKSLVFLALLAAPAFALNDLKEPATPADQSNMLIKISPSEYPGTTRLTTFSELAIEEGLRSSANIGTPNTVNGVEAIEWGTGKQHITELSFADLPLGILDTDSGAGHNGMVTIGVSRLVD
jgi:hypothetical protein